MDIKLFGIGIALTFGIIALSAIALYICFRIKETFRDEKCLRIQVAKNLFLIGMLFLAGGMFYFFAQGMSTGQQDITTTDINNSLFENGTIEKNGSIFFGISYPANIITGENCTISFKVYNPYPNTIHNASIRVIGLSLLEAQSNYNITSDSLDIGDIPSGTTSGYITSKAPAYGVILQGGLIFQSQNMDIVIQSVKITVINTTLPDNHNNSKNVSSQAPSSYYIIWQEPRSTKIENPTPTPVIMTTPTSIQNETQTTNITPNESNVPTPSPTPTPTPIITETPPQVLIPTPIPTPTITLIPTVTESQMLNLTPNPTPEPTPTITPTETPMVTPTPTTTPTPTPAVTSIVQG